MATGQENYTRAHIHMDTYAFYTRTPELAGIANRNLPQPEFVRSGLEYARCVSS